MSRIDQNATLTGDLNWWALIFILAPLSLVAVWEVARRLGLLHAGAGHTHRPAECARDRRASAGRGPRALGPRGAARSWRGAPSAGLGDGSFGRTSFRRAADEVAAGRMALRGSRPAQRRAADLLLRHPRRRG